MNVMHLNQIVLKRTKNPTSKLEGDNYATTMNRRE